jgi:pimeloyl-ACP methyl ester carboxylesterase
VTGGPPPLARLKWEALSGLELVRLIGQGPSLLRAPRGDRPVAVLPGFAADDASTLPLRAFLRRLGHEVEGWRLGRNRGHLDALVPRVAERVLERAARRGEGIHLIGQSLGGVIAREVARDRPAAVVQVITLGTPIVGGPTSTRVISKALSQELGPQGIRVTSVSPGPVATDLWLGEGGVAETVGEATGAGPDAVRDAAIADMPTGRFTSPREVATVVTLLASPRTANVTGANWVIDGGLIKTT